MKTQLIKWIRKFTEESNAKGYVVNISGGKDSTVVAALLVEAVGADKVYGILQPNGEQKDISDSIRVCDLLGIEYTIIDISDQYYSTINNIEYYRGVRNNDSKKRPVLDEKTKTNIPPRIRMMNARAIAQSMGFRFAGTGNLSERYIGWFTKDGDSACDFNIIAGLTCSQVIKLGDELGLPHDLVHKVPADGLTDKSDEDNFGFTYEQLDNYILNGTSGDRNIDDLIEVKHQQSLHKYGVYSPAMTLSYSGMSLSDLDTESISITPWFNEDGTLNIGESLGKQGYDIIDPEEGFYTTFIHNMFI